MGVCVSGRNKKIEGYTEGYTKTFKVYDINIITKQMNKSICLIDNENSKGTGFLCLIKNPKLNYEIKALITCNYILNDLKIGNEIKLIFNNKEKKIIIDKYKSIYKNIENDIVIVELKENEFDLDDYLQIDDLIYNENEIEAIYKGLQIYIIHYSKGKEAIYSVDKIKNIENNKIELYCDGSYGAPILNLNNYKVIGIYTGKEKDCYVGEIIKLTIDEFNKSKIKKEKNFEDNIKNARGVNNYIIGEIEIKEEDINKDIRIINSYDQYIREYYWEDNKEDYENEKEIKENCEIKINEEIIPFSYFYNFNKKGKYMIQYSFKNILLKINYMFFECSFLTNLNLSNFNTQNVIDMSYMFDRCNSLTNLNLSNFHTKNVINMSHMFKECSSLTKIDLSYFNTQNVINMSNLFSECKNLITLDLSNFNTENVTDMSSMFQECSSLTNINLSNFNTQNVKNMNCMFWDCKSLKIINLSNFNTQNITNMSFMFYNCSSLTNINLSNFITKNVTDMSFMFSGCSSITNINLSSFNTQNITYMNCMFYECRSLANLDLSNFKIQKVSNMRGMFYFCDLLKKENVIAKDKKIINEFNNLKFEKIKK